MASKTSRRRDWLRLLITDSTKKRWFCSRISRSNARRQRVRGRDAFLVPLDGIPTIWQLVRTYTKRALMVGSDPDMACLISSINTLYLGKGKVVGVTEMRQRVRWFQSEEISFYNCDSSTWSVNKSKNRGRRGGGGLLAIYKNYAYIPISRFKLNKIWFGSSRRMAVTSAKQPWRQKQ